jgi:hypothetical protein
MTTSHTAQGLASLGRNGDTMLVHMNPQEVMGLQGLAKTHGTSLTINPDTGMPEAFNLGKVFGAVAPMAAGFMFPGFGASLGLGAGIGAGALTGALIAAASGGDILTGGLTGGFGGYGGAGFGKSAMKLGTPASGVDAAAANTGVTQKFLGDVASGKAMGGAGVDLGSYLSNPNQFVSSQAGMGASAGAPGINLAKAAMPSNLASSAYNTALQPDVIGNITNLPTSIGSTALKGGDPAFNLGTATDALKSNPLGVAKDYGYGKTALMGGTSLMAGLEPSDLMPKQPIYKDPDAGKYRGSEGQLNLGDQFDTGVNLGGQGMKLAAQGGYINGYAGGGTVTTGGLRDLYGSTDSLSNPQLSRDGFGVGRLDNLARQQAMTQAQTTGYAMGGLTALKSGGQPGGYLDGQGDGMSDSIPATIEGKQPARLADGEFVVPADVVSHLGNGSSKAGSKRLYAMLDKVRHARTGNKKQGKEIKADKYLPA